MFLEKMAVGPFYIFQREGAKAILSNVGLPLPQFS